MNLLNQQDQENLVKILGELVKIDGGAQREINEDDFNFIVNFLKKNDFDIIEIIEDENFVPNLFALRRKNNQENKKIDLCFLGHLDVVDSGDFKFWKNQNPFEIFEEKISTKKT
jgi:acetylornithine deacetylase/succinyl-diaminopimelate desuccinylase-like protein